MLSCARRPYRAPRVLHTSAPFRDLGAEVNGQTFAARLKSCLQAP